MLPPPFDCDGAAIIWPDVATINFDALAETVHGDFVR
jgi:hypothetical protein